MSTTNMNYSQTELADLINATRAEVNKLLKSEEASGQPVAPTITKDEGSDSKPPPKKDESAPPADDKSSSAPPADASAPPADDASAPPPPAPDASTAPVDPAAGDASPPVDPSQASAAPPDSVESLKAAYAQLPPEALKAHFMALREVIAASVAAQSPAAPASPVAPAAVAAPPAGPPAAPPASAVAPPPAAPAMPPEAAMKNEKEMQEKLAKSEEKIAELSKGLETVTKLFDKIVRKPQRHGVRVMDPELVKSEPVQVDTKSMKRVDLLKAVSDLAKNPDLKKSDRQLINDYVAKRVSADKIQVLFDKK
jgi:hypothetical protein